MNITRRGLFRGALGALLAPVVAKIDLIAPKFGFRQPNLSELITATLRNRGDLVVDNVMKHNALLRHLSDKGKVER